MGAQVFSLGQKSMVFTTDERSAPPEGQFSSLDCWYMDQFARAIAVTALAGNGRPATQALEKKLGYSPQYWNGLPKDEGSIEKQYRELRDLINAAADPQSAAWRKLQSLMAHPGE